MKLTKKDILGVLLLYGVIVLGIIVLNARMEEINNNPNCVEVER